MSLQRDEVVAQNIHIVQVVEEACKMVPELAIPTEESVKARVHNLAAGVCDEREEMARVQLELNLQIAELYLKAQPSTPPKIKEQRTNTVTTTTSVVDNIVANCMQLFEQSFEVLTTLQEEPNVECLETEARELQQKYDEVKWTTQMASLT